MSASPVVITQKPILANADTLVHTANNLRRITDTIGAVGVFDLESWRVRQQVSGAGPSVDVTTAAVPSQAFIRGTSTNLQGLYLVTNVAQGTGTIDALYNVNISAGDATNPRIDQVFLCVEDAQHAGANTQATIRVVAGTPTGGATLDNRTGVGAAPAGMSSILLADVLQPAATTNVLTANIRDRRPVCNFGTVPWLGSTGSQLDMVGFEPHPALAVNNTSTLGLSATLVVTTHDSMQAAALMWLPRRIVLATKIRWKYLQGATPAASNFVLFVMDASGRNIASTAATAFSGGGNQSVEHSVALISAVTFEAGWYYVGIGVAPMTASSTVNYPGVPVMIANAFPTVGAAYRNLAFRSATGGTTTPTTILAFTDAVTLTAATAVPAVPVCSLSVT